MPSETDYSSLSQDELLTERQKIEGLLNKTLYDPAIEPEGGGRGWSLQRQTQEALKRNPDNRDVLSDCCARLEVIDALLLTQADRIEPPDSGGGWRMVAAVLAEPRNDPGLRKRRERQSRRG